MDSKQNIWRRVAVKLVWAGIYAVVGLLAGPIPRTHAAELPQYADFLTIPECKRGTTFYSAPATSTSARAACRSALKSRGYTHLYVSVAHKDKNWYLNPAGFRSLLQELVSAGIEPVVWLTSNTGSWKDKSISAIRTDLSNFIPQIDNLVSSYVLGVEIDEYWTTSEAASIGNHMQGLTSRKIAAHQVQNKWNYCKGASWCDYMLLQYKQPITVSQIKTITQQAKAELGKPVVASEYRADSPESVAIPLGTAADSGGSEGFGNGGVPPPFLIAPANNGSTTDRTPTFDWTDIRSTTYTLMVDNNSNFSSPAVNKSGLTSSAFTVAPLAPAVYYWRVSAKHSGGAVGPWSSVRKVTVK